MGCAWALLQRLRHRTNQQRRAWENSSGTLLGKRFLFGRSDGKKTVLAFSIADLKIKIGSPIQK
jgi:hypothetical protein